MALTTSRSKAAWLLGLGFLAAAGGSAPARAAAFTDRFAHTATLLPDGDILLVGGVDTAGTTLTSVQISLERQGTFLNAAPLTVARASHTATLLPNGEVLVAGGRNSGGVLNTAQVYNPVGNCWHAAITLAEALGRFNHTATLIKNGAVLVCGGQNSSGTMNATCELFTPAAADPTCAAAPGSFGATGSMSIPRSIHTATLLPNGRVFIAGGYDPTLCPTCSTTPTIVTTETYDPASQTFGSSHNLIQQRAYHTATLLGNGKALIVGGYNGKDDLGNRGILQTAEIYDPVSDSVIPAGSMLVRNHAHTATLDADGAVKMFGGLGNITTTFINASGALAAGNFINGCYYPFGTGNSSDCPASITPAAKLSSTSVNGGALTLSLDFQLSVPVTGIIQNGDVIFSTPQVNFGQGIAYFTPGTTNPGIGLRADLAGTKVYCPNDTPPCGQITRTFLLQNTSGQFFLFPLTVGGDINGLTGSQIGFIPSPRVDTDPPADIVPGTSLLNGPTTITLPLKFAGGTISSGTISLTGGGILHTSTDGTPLATITITGGITTIPVDTPITDNGQGSAVATFNASFSNIQGTVQITTSTSQSTPLSVNNKVLAGWTGTMNFAVTRVDLSGQSFFVDVATVIIRSMMFSDLESYNPQTNAWSFVEEAQGFGRQRYGHTATLAPNGDLRLLGGLACSGTANVDCPGLTARGSLTVIPKLPAWTGTTAMTGVRANHTSTLLANGKILIAGGTDGPSVLATAEIYDPAAKTAVPTGSMSEPRDLHTATLLVNGRVLAAGGFTTNAVSTGSTAGAEIYYPDTGVWLPARPMSTARDNHAAVLLGDGTVLVAGGYAAGTYLSSAEIYSSTSGVWRSAASMNAPRALHSVTLLQDGRVLATGGINQFGVQGSNEIYDPKTNIWTAVKCFDNGAFPCTGAQLRAHSHRATSLLDGRVLVTGGNDGFGEVDYSLIYDPVVNSWTDTSGLGTSLNTPRFNHTATLLPNGVVLIAGGAQKLGNALDSVETFSAAILTWQEAGKLTAPRGYHTTLIAKDGFLFSFGGYNGTTFVNSAESLYFAGFPDLLSVGAPPSARQPAITGVDLSPFDRGSFVTLTGANFQGRTEASGGAAAAGNSSHYHPRLILQAVEGSGGSGSQGSGSFTLDLTTRIFSNSSNLWTKTDSSITVRMPEALPSPGGGPYGGVFLPYGWYHLRAGSNAQYSDSVLIQAGPPKPAAPPTAIGATINSSDTVVWTWTSPGGAFDGYEVFSASSGIFITTVSFAAPGFTQTGLAPNTTAQIAVAAYTLSGDGPLGMSATFYTLAAPPVNLTVSAVGSSSLQLNWGVNGNTPATIYEVSESTDGFVSSFATPVPALLGLTTDHVTIDLLQPNTTYYFRLRAFNGAQIPSDFSAIVSTKTRSAVSGLQGSPCSPAGTTCIDWTWEASSGASFYKVYSATSGAAIGTPNSNAFQELNLSTNAPFSIQVSAVGDSGEGPLSPAATAFTLSAVPGVVSPPILNLSTGGFTAQWAANDNPLGTQYELTVSSSGIVINSITTADFNAGISGLSPPASIFAVSLRSLNAAGVPSPFVSLGSTATRANSPANLAVLGTTPSSINVAWSRNGNSPLATYEVTYSSDGFLSAQKGLAFSANSNQSALNITGLLTNTAYAIRVQARNSNGLTTAFSNSVTTLTFAGGAAAGSVGVTVIHDQETLLDNATLGNGREVSLRIPANTFPSDVFVSISSFNVTPVPGGPCGGADIAVSIAIDPDLQPSGPVLLTLSYSDAELAAAGISTDKLALMRVDSASARCVPLETKADTANKELTAKINHFSLFQAAQLSPSATPDTTLVFPNPFFPNRGNAYVTFSSMPAFARVRIFTLRGELVHDAAANASGLATWDARNDAGRAVASGIYLAVVEAGGSKKTYKLAVLR